MNLKFVQEIDALEDSSRSVIPARLRCLAREESRIPGPFARQPRARVTNPERAGPSHLHCALQTQDTSLKTILFGFLLLF